jgi:hypothetical protein
MTTTATSFPLSKHTGGGDTAPTFSGLSVCLQLTWEVDLPPSPVEFSSHSRFYKLSCSWLLDACPCSRPLRPGPACLFTVPGGIPLPPFIAHGTVLTAYYSVSLFSPGGVSLSRGLC